MERVVRIEDRNPSAGIGEDWGCGNRGEKEQEKFSGTTAEACWYLWKGNRQMMGGDGQPLGEVRFRTSIGVKRIQRN